MSQSESSSSSVSTEDGFSNSMPFEASSTLMQPTLLLLASSAKSPAAVSFRSFLLLLLVGSLERNFIAMAAGGKQGRGCWVMLRGRRSAERAVHLLQWAGWRRWRPSDILELPLLHVWRCPHCRSSSTTKGQQLLPLKELLLCTVPQAQLAAAFG